MQQYKYTALNLRKEKIKGTFIAKDEKDLASQLAKQGLFLVDCAPYSGGTPSAFFTLGTGKVKMSELTSFCRQFAIMQNTAIPILDCLDILKNQPYTSYFKSILQVVYEDVKSGILLSQALDKHKKVFPDFFRSMVAVGEKTGKMDVVFNSLADYYEKDSTLKKKTKSAMSYPMMLMGMTVAILVLMVVFVVPTFRNSMSSLHVEPEGITKVVYDFSDWVLASWRGLVVGIIVVVGGIILFKKTETGKYFFDVVKLKIPFLKTVQLNTITARFARGFGLLLSSGMDLNEALDVIDIVLGNRYFRKKFRMAAEDVRHGMSMTLAFESHKLFPPMMLQMITIGEKTASMDEILTRSSAFFDGQVESSLNSLISKIQPVMLLIMGGVVGTLFIAVYSPMISIMNGLGR